MTTNVLASILTLFVTNSVEHWPQKSVQTSERDYNQSYLIWIDQPTPQDLENLHPFKWVSTDDTTADTKSVETTVTRQRLLSFEALGRSFTETLTNETVQHFQVDYRRVRTNEWYEVDDDWYAANMTNQVVGYFQISHA